MSGGMAFEALNNMGRSKANVLVIVNDNKMGIDPSTGALTAHLNAIEESSSNIFQNLGLHYSGPIDGHSIPVLLHALKDLSEIDGPKVLHIKTIKGKGYKEAEEQQTRWHAVKYVKITPGKEGREEALPKFQDVFGETLLNMARQDERVIGITPAMPSGSSMNIMQKELPQRVFDVGIAEQHAVTFSAGLALDGMRPFCNIYSSFAQRAYDQIIHDVALQKIPVVFCLDRSGLVGEDGPTHHGVFDLAYLNPIPNLKVLAPLDQFELTDMMHWAKDHLDGPVVIRYPKGRSRISQRLSPVNSFDIKPRKLRSGKDLAVLSLGEIGSELLFIDSHKDLNYSHYDMRISKPLEIEHIHRILDQYSMIITLEDGVIQGGFGQHIQSLALEYGYNGNIKTLGIPDDFISHGTVEELREELGLDCAGILKVIRGMM